MVVIVALPFTASAIVLVDDKYSGDQLTSGNFKYIIKNKEVSITDVVSSPSGDVVIPETLGGYPVTAIYRHAFVKCTSITSIVLPEGLKEIARGAFKDCTSLKSINIPSTVTLLADDAFLNCKSLTNVYITDLKAWCKTDFCNSSANPMSYAKNLYVNGERVALSGDFVFPEGISKIGRGLFCGNKELTSVTIPNSVMSIGVSAFNGCTGLRAVYAESLFHWCEIEFVGDTSNPLSYAKNLYIDGVKLSGQLTIPDNIKKINRFAFSDCEGITDVTMPYGVKVIDACAFAGCPDLTSVTLSDIVTTIGNQAFWGCESLKSITLSDSLTYIDGYAFKECESLESITIPNGVTTIEPHTFLGCKSLTSLTLPDTLITIDECAFWDCKSLTIVKIPNSVTTIGNYAFRFCDNLMAINIPDGASVGELVFEGCDNLTTYRGEFPTEAEIQEHQARARYLNWIIPCGIAVVLICVAILLIVWKKKPKSDTQ